MFSAEVLSQLRSLNWLAQEVRRLPAGSLEGVRLQEQIATVRARLPNSILGYHDQFAARGKPSIAPVDGRHCSACHGALPAALLAELAGPRRFGVCPHCGVFLWSADHTDPVASTPPEQPKPLSTLTSHPSPLTSAPSPLTPAPAPALSSARPSGSKSDHV